ncbi:taurine catabolism dioxygenase [Cordyceps militaris]|uniref:Taurine catabolism dioxygenase n=1 Tax=Cordyceps militaris TaxID=73501 RepID=A0A2H4SCS0_CORMI|nr:taurine catabolism dioxygenase [Cordyceps militaris]
MASLASTLLRSGRTKGWGCVRPHLRLGCPASSRLLYATNSRLSHAVTTLLAPDLSYSQNVDHVGLVARHLEQDGILRITLGFRDDASRYLEGLIRSLHAHHGHRLPLAHSATRGWFWDVRPSFGAASSIQTAHHHQARSETMDEFPWHTDCSYEYPPPRYFALQVLRADRFGGGTLSVLSAARLGAHLDAATRATLMRGDAFRIAIPAEFVKDPAAPTAIRGRLLVADAQGRPALIRFREDIVTPLDEAAAAALAALRAAIQHLAAQKHETMHFAAADLPAGSVILLDNRRWLHARNEVTDPERHLRRVRWDAAPFPGMEETTEELLTEAEQAEQAKVSDRKAA